MTRNSRPWSSVSNGIVGLVGWLFADLLLGLMVVFLGSQSGQPIPAATAAPTPSPTSAIALMSTLTAQEGESTATSVTLTSTPPTVPTRSPTPTSTPTARPVRVGLDPQPIEWQGVRFTSLNPGLTREDIRKRIEADRRFVNSRAGLVIVSGYTTYPVYEPGRQAAVGFGSLLTSTFPAVFGDALVRPFFLYAATPGFVDVEIYLFTQILE